LFKKREISQCAVKQGILSSSEVYDCKITVARPDKEDWEHILALNSFFSLSNLKYFSDVNRIRTNRPKTHKPLFLPVSSCLSANQGLVNKETPHGDQTI